MFLRVWSHGTRSIGGGLHQFLLSLSYLPRICILELIWISNLAGTPLTESLRVYPHGEPEPWIYVDGYLNI